MFVPSQLAARHAAATPLAARHTLPRRAQRSDNSVRCFSNADGNIQISFSVPYHCKYGQRLCVIGASDNLGAWNVANAIPMEWTEGDVWIVDLKLPKDGSTASLEYKYVVRSERDMEAVRWKEGGNFQLRLPAQGRLRVRDTWDESCREVEFEDGPAPQPAAAPPPPQEAAPPPLPAPQPAVQEVQAAAQPAQAVAAAAPPAAVDATAPVVRRRRKKVDEAAELQASISKAADKAMQQLDAAVTRSLDLLGTTADPAAPELLAADRLVAAAAKRATTMNRALDAAKEAKMLPSASTGGSGKAGAGKQGSPRRRRAAVANREGSPSRSQ